MSTSNHSIAFMTNSRISAKIFIQTEGKCTLEIANSKFNGSCVEFQVSKDYVNVGLRNTSLVYSVHSCWSVLSLRGNNQYIKVTLYDVNITDNSSPYVVHANGTVSILLEGNNHFHCNKVVMYIARSSLQFLGTYVEFINNLINNTRGSPIHARDMSFISMEHSNFLFHNNHGLLCGGIAATDKTQILNTTV